MIMLNDTLGIFLFGLLFAVLMKGGWDMGLHGRLHDDSVMRNLGWLVFIVSLAALGFLAAVMT